MTITVRRQGVCAWQLALSQCQTMHLYDLGHAQPTGSVEPIPVQVASPISVQFPKAEAGLGQGKQESKSLGSRRNLCAMCLGKKSGAFLPTSNYLDLSRGRKDKL